ncbi:MAG: four helix bundle suffix domain-containing protein [Polyangia bacterium]
MSTDSPKLVLPHGGYRKLLSFRCARLVYDGTVVFCDRFVDRFSRTRDQMVQAARSGVQNIAEGSMASATSQKMEIKLTGVARASIEELILDYEDFLRQRGLRQWAPESEQALAVRGWYRASDRSDRSDLSTLPPEPAANVLLCLANQASYLLGRQIRGLELRLVRGGGFTERLYRTRRRSRG